MKIQHETLRMIVHKISITRPEEIECDTCYQELNRFADMLLQGEEPSIVMPLVQHHLEMCNSCGEEFQALLDALKAAEVA